MLRQQVEEDIFLMEVSKMNRKTIVASLNKIANELDAVGKFQEANEVTTVMVKISQFITPGIDMDALPTIPSTPEAKKSPATKKPGGTLNRNTMEYSGSKKTYLGKNPMEYSGYKNPEKTEEARQSAQEWININSKLVGGDINKLIAKAEEGKSLARDKESAKKYNDALYILKQNPKFDNAYGIEALNSLPPGQKPGTSDEDVDQWARGYYKQHGQYDNYDGLVLISRKLYPDWKSGKITDRKYDAVLKMIRKYTPEHLVGWKDPRYTNFNK